MKTFWNAILGAQRGLLLAPMIALFAWKNLTPRKGTLMAASALYLLHQSDTMHLHYRMAAVLTEPLQEQGKGGGLPGRTYCQRRTRSWPAGCRP